MAPSRFDALARLVAAPPSRRRPRCVGRACGQCLPIGERCAANSECCSANCGTGNISSVCCGGPGTGCSHPGQCCGFTNVCGSGGRCCLLTASTCKHSSDCCSRACVPLLHRCV